MKEETILFQIHGLRRNVIINPHFSRIFRDRKWAIPFFTTLLVAATLVLVAFSRIYLPTYDDDEQSRFVVMSIVKSEVSIDYFVEDEIKKFRELNKKMMNEPPRFAYLISGTKGDCHRVMRVLQAVYHPRNQCVLHMDFEGPTKERSDLTMSVKSDLTFHEVENVRVMDKSDLVTYKGPTMIACTLQAISIQLRESSDWDWFINLSASDYPVMTQDVLLGRNCLLGSRAGRTPEYLSLDPAKEGPATIRVVDLLHVFSSLSQNLGFIEHVQMVEGWKFLYLSKKSDLAVTSQRRTLPTAFKLFTGSAWVVLTRSFVEYCIWGRDNFPRTLLLYLTNFISSPESYFHTAMCNTQEFHDTAIAHDLHYIAWDNPPKQHPRVLTIKDLDKMVKSGAVFARKIAKGDQILDKIDQELLGWSNQFSPGSWRIGSVKGGDGPCFLRGDFSELKPGNGAERLQMLLNTLLSREFRSKQCF